MKLGMPILYEFNSIKENIELAKSLGLDFVELNSYNIGIPSFIIYSPLKL